MALWPNYKNFILRTVEVVNPSALLRRFLDLKTTLQMRRVKKPKTAALGIAIITTSLTRLFAVFTLFSLQYSIFHENENSVPLHKCSANLPITSEHKNEENKSKSNVEK